MYGVTRIDGNNVNTALTVISEVGSDLSRSPSAKHFTSWLGVCPVARTSGGKVLSSASKRSHNRAAQAYKLAAGGLPTKASNITKNATASGSSVTSENSPQNSV